LEFIILSRLTDGMTIGCPIRKRLFPIQSMVRNGTEFGNGSWLGPPSLLDKEILLVIKLLHTRIEMNFQDNNGFLKHGFKKINIQPLHVVQSFSTLK
jgi:hypothetical protein